MKVLLVIALLVVAQIIPSCGRGEGDEGGSASAPQVIGWVQEKRTRTIEPVPYLIVINQIEYGVPYEFWLAVEVGDLVKYQDGKWSIVRRRGR